MDNHTVRILLVEDDELLGDGIQAVLSQRGFVVDWVLDGLKGQKAFHTAQYDVVLLDLNLPGLPGLSLLREMRTSGNRIPVLVLTARLSVSDRVLALDNGADDYLVKPFDTEELCARIRALHRRSLGQLVTRYQVGDLQLDLDSRKVKVGERLVKLSVSEFDVLKVLMESQGRVLSRHHLEESLTDGRKDVESNVVEVHIHHLRKKLDTSLIRTVRGVGYIIENPRV